MTVYNRKLIRTAGYSYLVCLPKSFIELNNLQNAYAINLELRKDGSLLIKPEGKK